jgi:hypothetical protein
MTIHVLSASRTAGWISDRRRDNSVWHHVKTTYVTHPEFYSVGAYGLSIEHEQVSSRSRSLIYRYILLRHEYVEVHLTSPTRHQGVWLSEATLYLYIYYGIKKKLFYWSFLRVKFLIIWLDYLIYIVLKYSHL